MLRRTVTALAALLMGVIAVSPRVEMQASASPPPHTLASVEAEDAVQGATPAARSNGSAPVDGLFVSTATSDATALAMLAGTAVKQSVTQALADAPSACPANTVEVEGDYCPWLEQKCLRWLDPEMKLRCAEFQTTSKCLTKTQKKHFCIDKYEYPNKVGEKPVVMKTWHEAVAACKSEGKRLCKDSEWTLACEGQERLPYPYGYARNAEACNIDKPHPDPDERALANPATRAIEAARLDQRSPSGAHEACVSPYGVVDMAGNVDEWVVNESKFPYQSGSKGGYWGPVRTRCRPMTTAHYEDFSFYQLGFRCCGDADKKPAAGAPAVAAPGLRPAAPTANAGLAGT